MRATGFLVSVLGLASLSETAYACVLSANRDNAAVVQADTVVIGRVENYERVLDQKVRDRRKTLLENLPDDASPHYREMLESQTGFISDYVRFEVVVDEVLRGKPVERVPVAWNNSTFSEADRLEGQYIFALNTPGTAVPLRNASPDPALFSVLQAPCAPPFIVPAGSPDALAIRAILAE